MIIKELERVIFSNENGIQMSRLSNDEEIINKINEIVRYINKNETNKKDQITNNPFAPREEK